MLETDGHRTIPSKRRVIFTKITVDLEYRSDEIVNELESDGWVEVIVDAIVKSYLIEAK